MDNGKSLRNKGTDNKESWAWDWEIIIKKQKWNIIN